MKIEIIGRADIREEKIGELIAGIDDKLGFDCSKSDLEILFVDSDEIKKYNLVFRKIDKPTNVLSFPQIAIGKNKPTLGSIVICLDIAKDRGETTEELIEHGYLHLLGYDHDKDQSAWDKILEKIYE